MIWHILEMISSCEVLIPNSVSRYSAVCESVIGLSASKTSSEYRPTARRYSPQTSSQYPMESTSVPSISNNACVNCMLIQILPEHFFSPLIVRQIFSDQRIERAAVVVVLDMRQFMHDNIVDSIFRIAHEYVGKADRVLAAAASETRMRRRDFDAFRLDAHEFGVVLHLWRDLVVQAP